jgi:hypothetical protein
VEGPDGAGKSTLVRELCSRFNLSEGVRGTSDRKLLYTVTVSDTMQALIGAVDGRQPTRIWDRLYYSELVYADLVGRPVEFNATQRSFIQRTIEALRCPIIVCLPPFKVVRANAAKAEQMKGVNENLGAIYAQYKERLIDGTFPDHTLVYDYTYRADESPDLSEIVTEVKDYLDERSDRAWTVPTPH